MFLNDTHRRIFATTTLVRRHINWNNQRPDLREDLAHLVQDIKRRICGIASAGLPKMAFLVKMFIRFYHLQMTLNKNV